MIINLVGCGKMGRSTSYYLASQGVSKINLMDSDRKAEVSLSSYLKLHFEHLEISCEKNGKGNLYILCLAWKQTFLLMKEIFDKNPEAKIVTITRPDDSDLPALYALKEKYNFLLPCGLEPGLTEIIPTYFLKKKSDKVKSIKIFCGGLTDEPTPPLSYGLLFGGQLSLSNNNSYYIFDGIPSATEKLEGEESLFLKNFGILDAYHDGMMKSFCDFLHGYGVLNATQKTLRYPGYIHVMRTLRGLDLLNDEEVSLDGHPSINPKKWLSDYLISNHKLSVSKNDKTILHINIDGDEFSLLSEYNSNNDCSGMAIITGFTAAFCSINFFQASNISTSFFPHEFFNSHVVECLIEELLKIQSVSLIEK